MSPHVVALLFMVVFHAVHTYLDYRAQRQLRTENAKLMAALMAEKVSPLASAVFQTYDPSDERSPDQRLSDTKQAQQRDIRILGL